jgi:formylglycine-generating enzyme required for sulfatase activity
MVYVRGGSFYVGDGKNNASSPAGALFVPISPYDAFQITSEAALLLGGQLAPDIWAKSGMSTVDDFTSVTPKTLPAAYPKGYNAFYLMKYELSHGQYVAFLNTLARSHQTNVVVATITGDTISNYYVMSDTSLASKRNTITAPSAGNGTVNPVVFSASRPDRAMNYLSWVYAAAVADWMALRPITETEFEKAARGTASPVTDEMAWGDSTSTIAATISGTENGTETITTTLANLNAANTTFSGGDGGNGPLRAGIFATGTSTTRARSGASAWGAMELSGNLEEWTVTTGNPSGRAFTGLHGNGQTPRGFADTSDWPGYDGGEVTGNGGAGLRGGSFEASSALSRVSDRTYVNDTITGLNANDSRGVRFGRDAE